MLLPDFLAYLQHAHLLQTRIQLCAFKGFGEHANSVFSLFYAALGQGGRSQVQIFLVHLEKTMHVSFLLFDLQKMKKAAFYVFL